MNDSPKRHLEKPLLEVQLKSGMTLIERSGYFIVELVLTRLEISKEKIRRLTSLKFQLFIFSFV